MTNYKRYKRIAELEAKTEIDTISDINDEKVSREDLWRSAYVCGALYVESVYEKAFSNALSVDEEKDEGEK